MAARIRILVAAAFLIALVGSLLMGGWNPVLLFLLGVAIGSGAVLVTWVVLNLLDMPFGTERWLRRWGQ